DGSKESSGNGNGNGNGNGSGSGSHVNDMRDGLTAEDGKTTGSRVPGSAFIALAADTGTPGGIGGCRSGISRGGDDEGGGCSGPGDGRDADVEEDRLLAIYDALWDVVRAVERWQVGVHRWQVKVWKQQIAMRAQTLAMIAAFTGISE
ncbi:hypothetical protein VaNZ11_002193, partial [Volvox africanus]